LLRVWCWGAISGIVVKAGIVPNSLVTVLTGFTLCCSDFGGLFGVVWLNNTTELVVAIRHQTKQLKKKNKFLIYR
jgi:hypothetical protein